MYVQTWGFHLQSQHFRDPQASLRVMLKLRARNSLWVLLGVLLHLPQRGADPHTSILGTERKEGRTILNLKLSSSTSSPDHEFHSACINSTGQGHLAKLLFLRRGTIAQWYIAQTYKVRLTQAQSLVCSVALSYLTSLYLFFLSWKGILYYLPFKVALRTQWIKIFTGTSK